MVHLKKTQAAVSTVKDVELSSGDGSSSDLSLKSSIDSDGNSIEHEEDEKSAAKKVNKMLESSSDSEDDTQ